MFETIYTLKYNAYEQKVYKTKPVIRNKKRDYFQVTFLPIIKAFQKTKKICEISIVFTNMFIEIIN